MMNLLKSIGISLCLTLIVSCGGKADATYLPSLFDQMQIINHIHDQSFSQAQTTLSEAGFSPLDISALQAVDILAGDKEMVPGRGIPTPVESLISRNEGDLATFTHTLPDTGIAIHLILYTTDDQILSMVWFAQFDLPLSRALVRTNIQQELYQLSLPAQTQFTTGFLTGYPNGLGWFYLWLIP